MSPTKKISSGVSVQSPVAGLEKSGVSADIVVYSHEMGPFLHQLLDSESLQVRYFHDAQAALVAIAAQAPDLVLLETHLPGMDGFELCRKIKSDESLSGIPVIFISAAASADDMLRAFAVGGVDYLGKPFHREEILARVKTHVELFRARQELQRTAAALQLSEERLKVAQAFAHLGYWEMDLATGETHWSDETFRIFGHEPNSFVPSYEFFMRAVHPDDRARVEKYFTETRGDEKIDIEYRIILPGGKVRVVHGVGKGEQKIVATVQEVMNTPELLGIVQDVTLQKEMEMRLAEEAHTDSLTGVATRRHFLQLAEQELARTRRYGGELSLLMLDLDHFKKINDQYGHAAGDLVLQSLARICMEVMRKEDLVCRLGGEEFCILLPQTATAEAVEAAQRLRNALATAEIPVEKNPALHFTASIGVATLLADEIAVGSMLLRADRALYRAKSAGRNKVVAA